MLWHLYDQYFTGFRSQLVVILGGNVDGRVEKSLIRLNQVEVNQPKFSWSQGLDTEQAFQHILFKNEL